MDDVVDGDLQATVCDRATLEAFKRRKPGRFNQLRPIAESKPFPAAAVVAHYGTNLDEATLRKVAAAYLRREHANHTLQPTELVNEAYVRLLRGKAPAIGDRVHFALEVRSFTVPFQLRCRFEKNFSERFAGKKVEGFTKGQGRLVEFAAASRIQGSWRETDRGSDCEKVAKFHRWSGCHCDCGAKFRLRQRVCEKSAAGASRIAPVRRDSWERTWLHQNVSRAARGIDTARPSASPRREFAFHHWSQS